MIPHIANKSVKNYYIAGICFRFSRNKKICHHILQREVQFGTKCNFFALWTDKLGRIWEQKYLGTKLMLIKAHFLILPGTSTVRETKILSNGVVLILYLLMWRIMWRIWWAPNNASKGQMGFNSAFKELSHNKISSSPTDVLNLLVSLCLLSTFLFSFCLRSLELRWHLISKGSQA